MIIDNDNHGIFNIENLQMNNIMFHQRNRLEIYCDILRAIEKNPKDGAKRTIVQRQSGMSYDRLVKYLDEMKKHDLIVKNKRVHVSKKGSRYLQDCKKLNKQTRLIQRKYFR